MDTGKLMVAKTAYTLTVRTLIKLIELLPSCLIEYILLPREKWLATKNKSSCLITAFTELVSVIEILTGCRDGKANWKAIYEVFAYF